MRGLLRMSALVCLVAIAPAPRSSADVVFNLADVELAVGGTAAGTLTGSFTLSDDLATLLAADVTASGALVNGFTFEPVTYTLANSTFFTNNLASYFQLSQGSTDELRLVFDGPLAATGGSLSSMSYEWQWTAGNRIVTSGSYAPSTPAVPEPSSLALAAIAAGSAAAFGMRRARRRQAAC